MTKLLTPGTRKRACQSGFSLIELMIAITLGLIIMVGLISIFVKNSQARSEIERSNRQLESGRYAMSLLTEDLRMAGFLSSFNPYELIIGASNPPLGADPVLGTPAMTTMPDPCATSVTALNNAYFFHVQGYDNAATVPSCVSDARTGSDILVIRRLATCVAGPTLEAGCEPVVSGAPYFQASNCYQATELAKNSGGVAQVKDYQAHFALDTNIANLTKHTITCDTATPTYAEYRRYLTRIYFVANNNVSGDGIPTLKRAELGATGFTIVPLVEGIETIQFEFGIGNTVNSAKIDAYTADPGTYHSCSPPSNACVLNWLHAYAVKVNLLARNVEQSPGWTDNKSYTLGQKADGTANVFPVSGTYGDAYKRHAYNAVVRLDNPSGRVTP